MARPLILDQLEWHRRDGRPATWLHQRPAGTHDPPRGSKVNAGVRLGGHTTGLHATSQKSSILVPNGRHRRGDPVRNSVTTKQLVPNSQGQQHPGRKSSMWGLDAAAPGTAGLAWPPLPRQQHHIKRKSSKTTVVVS